MDDLISRDFIKSLGGECIAARDSKTHELLPISSVDALPPAQPEIVRCKDCKYSEHWYKDKTRCFLWHETGIDVFEDGYCNYAKRRTDVDMRGKQDE